MRPGPKLTPSHESHVVENTVGIQSKQTYSTIGLNEVRIKFEFYEQSSNSEKNEFNIGRHHTGTIFRADIKSNNLCQQLVMSAVNTLFCKVIESFVIFDTVTSAVEAIT